ncbi:hypothetical protein [Escherichia coli]|uniref:hypothetical protein n=1 Tax=Escherichia coli TaxID=562 RepID=UPI00215AE7B8|nr:hypothetical protein [Escherichia coli]
MSGCYRRQPVAVELKLNALPSLPAQLISTTKKEITADFYNKNNSKVKVDLSKIPDNEIIDVSNGQGLSGKASRYARKDKEVILTNGIPPGSYEIVK